MTKLALFTKDKNLSKALEELIDKKETPSLFDSLDKINPKDFDCILLALGDIKKEEVISYDKLLQATTAIFLNNPLQEGVDLSKFYVLFSPLDPIDLTLLFSLIEQDKVFSGDLDVELKEYRRSIFTKIKFIRDQIEIYDKERTKEHLENVKKPIHKLAGSGGLYGFDKVSSFCKQTETALNSKIAAFEQGCDETKDTLLKTLEEIKKCFIQAPAQQQPSETQNQTASTTPSQKSSDTQKQVQQEAPKPSEPQKQVQEKAQEPQKEPQKEQASTCELYLVDDDEDLIKIIEKTAKSKNIKIQTCASFAKAFELFKDPNFNPKFLLIDLHSDKEEITGYDLIKCFREHNPFASSTYIGILSAKKELSDKFKATELGIDLYFEKPVSPDVLLYQIQKLNDTSIAGTQQILLIDDDVDFCKAIASGFKSSPFELTMYHDGNDFFKRIDQGNYALLLLDLALPGHNGLELLATLRSDYRYRKLPVIIITASNDPETIKKAYSLGVQDYIVKPISPQNFRAQVENILKKKQSFDVLYEKDDRYNLYTKKSLFDFFSTYSINYSHICVATFLLSKLDLNFQQAFAKKLEEFFGKQDIKGVWQDGVFVVLLIQLMPMQIRIIIETFYDLLKEIEIFRDKTNNVNVAISLYPNDGNNLDALVSKSLTLLDSSKNTYFGISIFEQTQEVKSQKGKYIFLISHNKTLSKAIEYALNLRGYTVKLSSAGQESYQFITSHFLKDPPSIIILDSELKDEDSIILLEKFKRLIGERIPILYLSQRSREEDITEGLSKGASSYITKPFSMSMLLQRIEQRNR